ncbi:hypothetical protein GP486_000180 [Trichoglossum hirsutum]|uniref:Protein kinase domain-containing protein n=1 Tax=Trichoglossum hirsutum TaxID=265104 RepID=A0A9P8RU57_9PEZI|nr:hypothetical protein GP486_000180 [Trichoglossum hirsutum]
MNEGNMAGNPTRLHLNTTSLTPATNSSTPIRSGSGNLDLAEETKTSRNRAKILYEYIMSQGKLFFEKDQLCSKMLSYYMDRLGNSYDEFASRVAAIDEVKKFLDSVGQRRGNEGEFADMVDAVFKQLASLPAFQDRWIRYVHSGNDGIEARKHAHPWVADWDDPKNLLKMDFYTVMVERASESDDWRPVSLSTRMHGYKGQEEQRQQKKQEQQDPPPGIFRKFSHGSWDDARILVELKSNIKHISSIPDLSNMFLKAAQILRFQPNRHFVLGLYICGSSVRVVRCDRTCVLVGAPVNFGSNPALLVKVLVAGFVLDGNDVGFLEGDQAVSMEDVDGKLQPVVVIGQSREKFVLDKQISGPEKDRLIGRGTTVHLAHRLGDPRQQCCIKCAWAHPERPHEAEFLMLLSHVSGVVELLSWDALRLSEVPESIITGFRRCISGRTTPVVDSSTASPLGTLFQPRQLRRTVTSYIGDSFSTTQLSTLDFLKAWLGLFKTISSVLKENIVHRDLSHGNVRFDESKSPKIIDFELAHRIDCGESTVNVTGTPLFMSVEMLFYSEFSQRVYQELHELESGFWVFFFGILLRTQSGKDKLKALQIHALSTGMRGLGEAKWTMIRGPLILEWANWFGQDEDGKLLMNLCRQIVDILYKEGITFPSFEERNKDGKRKHRERYETVKNDILNVLNESIESHKSSVSV